MQVFYFILLVRRALVRSHGSLLFSSCMVLSARECYRPSVRLCHGWISQKNGEGRIMAFLPCSSAIIFLW